MKYKLFVDRIIVPAKPYTGEELVSIYKSLHRKGYKAHTMRTLKEARHVFEGQKQFTKNSAYGQDLYVGVIILRRFKVIDIYCSAYNG